MPSVPRAASRGLAASVSGALALLALLAAGLEASRSGSTPDRAPRAVHFSRDVRPLLSDRCFQCHGPDEAARRGELRLDTFALATADRGGYAAVVPGDPERSELWTRVTSDDPEEAMPPAGAHRARLSDPERELLRRWIEEGANYEEHWAFVPPRRPAPPAELGREHPVDAFVGRALAERGFEPSPEETPELLLRRLFLDVTGLPPTLSELDEFLAAYGASAGARAEPGRPDTRDDVWAAWIDRLFREEPYRSRHAERMATPWLDQARYADTNGIHMDAGRQIWPWRDWVLDAYRGNMPFDQFLTEQLAGDLIPDADTAQLVASGFHRNHVITDEGGAIDEEYLVEYAVDRTDTTGQVFLGLTMGCARCHDHKFDPITQEDYYGLFAFFNSNDEPGLYSQESDPLRSFEPSLELPSPAQVARRVALANELEQVRRARLAVSDEERAEHALWRAAVQGELGLVWHATQLVAADSRGGAEFTELEDGSLLASGAIPATDVHRFTLRTEASELRLLQLDALNHPSLASGAPGRGENGNAVLTSITVEAVSSLDPALRRPVELVWAWSDFGQSDSDDWGVLRAFDPRPNTGWAIGGHLDGSERSALFLAAEPFGFEGGTDVIVSLGYESIWAGLALGRTRLGLASLPDEASTRLPLAQSRWLEAGPFALDGATGAYQAEFGPERDTSFDRERLFDAEGAFPLRWSYRAAFADGRVTALTSGTNVTYLGKELWSPDARAVEVSLGSDDGFALYLNGERVAAREVPRGVAADQDRVTLELEQGRNALVFKVVNTGGQAGFYFRALESDRVLAGASPGALLVDASREDTDPDYEPRAAALAPPLPEQLLHAWRLGQSETYAANLAREAEIEAAQAALEAAIPRTMVMRERAEPRLAFVLDRGEYDKADASRPVQPRFPAVFGDRSARPAADGERSSRLDLAGWLTDPQHPLVSRVAVNRLWQLLFGRGLVATSGDFGYQGAWPSHPELLDWLAVELVESGWDVQGLLKTILTSGTYRQSSRVRPELRELDPDGAWLGSFPRRRLSAEAVRDIALYVSGLLVEELGGPSVKPYQPPGLWREIAMLGSNTRTFERGAGDDLWRRSLYTYWKRAAPPPAMLTFDAPTRESCVIQRATTTTPLQALVLWNDEQFVEAARVLAERTLAEADEPRADDPGLVAMFRRCTGRRPNAGELAVLRRTLAEHRERYAAAPDDAAALLATGEAPADASIDPGELAAWTLVASTILNLHATITQG